MGTAALPSFRDREGGAARVHGSQVDAEKRRATAAVPVRSPLSRPPDPHHSGPMSGQTGSAEPAALRPLADVFARCRAWLRARGSRDSRIDLCLIGTTLLLYAPVLARGDFVWDDTVLLDRNSLVTGEATLRTVWTREDFPLSLAVLAGLHALWGKSALAFHWFNVLLHALAAVLVRHVLSRMGLPAATAAAIWFAWHPVAVASAAWISEVKNTLSLTLALGSALGWIAFSRRWLPEGATVPERQSRFKQASSLATAWTAFALALLAKTSVVGLPVALLAWVYWRTGRCPKWAMAGLLPLFALALAMGLRTVWLHTHQVLAGAVLPEADGMPLGLRVARTWWFYAVQALWPAELCLIYPQWERGVSGGIVAWQLAGLVALAAGALAAAWRGWRGLLAWLGAYTASVFPFLGFFPIYFFAMAPVSDHFAYFSLAVVAAGVSGVLSSGARWASEFSGKRIRRVGMVGLGLGLVLLAGLSHRRVQLFVDDFTLWQATLRCNPRAWVAHNNLGTFFAERGDLGRAAEHFRRALEIYPHNAAAQQNLGRALAALGQWGEAAEHYGRAVALQPRNVAARRGWAEALEQLGRLEEAARVLREALGMQDDVAIRLDLAAVLRRADDLAGAVAELSAALATHPGDADVMNNLAWLLATAHDARLRDPARAVELATRACELDPDNPRMHGTLAAALAAAGRFDQAAAEAERAAELAQRRGDGMFAELNRRLAALYRQGRAYVDPPVRRVDRRFPTQ